MDGVCCSHDDPGSTGDEPCCSQVFLRTRRVTRNLCMLNPRGSNVIGVHDRHHRERIRKQNDKEDWGLRVHIASSSGLKTDVTKLPSVHGAGEREEGEFCFFFHENRFTFFFHQHQSTNFGYIFLGLTNQSYLRIG